jgi:hypothetical protein
MRDCLNAHNAHIETINTMNFTISQQLDLTNEQVVVAKHKIISNAGFTFKDLKLYKNTEDALKQYNSTVNKISSIIEKFKNK